MAMLAEPRSRQKWSQDPRNTTWANDKTKFGYQMMTKMGWAEGKGLGANLSGGTKHIGVKKKKGSHGVGATVATDDNWIAHQDDFNALLGALNQGLPCPEAPASDPLSQKIASLESSVKSSSKKIMYQKYVRGKDLSRASANDLASIFGQRSKSAPSTPQLSDDEAAIDSDGSTYSEPTDQGMQIITSSMDMNEYFAAKMAAFKLRREMKLKEESLAKESGKYANDLSKIEEETTEKEKSLKEECREEDVTKKEVTFDTDGTIAHTKKKKKKKKAERKIDDEDSKPIDAIQEEEDSSSKPKKKKKKKKTIEEPLRTSTSDEKLCYEGNYEKESENIENAAETQENAFAQTNCVENAELVDMKIKKKKKKRKIKDMETFSVVEGSINDDSKETDTKKKKRKRKRDAEEEEGVEKDPHDSQTTVSCGTPEDPPVKKKKKKKKECPET